ncbi:MAG: anaerobic ribonucleoside-triphosphate reductase activating protein [Candidatus Melainabacteria bacterium]|nr:MAG: anaerobic ribonucleoside-triphosphate reductase activating protein [Candidatus Melainabacteria bacterium]
MSFKLAGLQKTTFIDYPEKIACIVFTQGCNFRCGYCHNPELFENKEPVLSVPAFFEFLNKRKGKLDGVVITGGEPTLHGKDLIEFIKEVKSLGFLVKLDTNGTHPDVLQELLNENLLDYIAMDIKAPLAKYKTITQTDIDTKIVKKSIDMIMNSGVDYEFRTTIVKSQLSVEDLRQIGELIQGAKRYYMQKFLATKILDETLMSEESYTDEEFKNLRTILEEYVDFVDYR